MLSSKLNKSSENEESVIQFLTESKHPTMWISTCTLDSGGCHSFGENAAQELKHDYVGVEVDMSDRSEPQITKEFKQVIALQQPYQNVCITGCCFSSPTILEQTGKKYNFSKIQHVYVVAPPHIIIKDHKSASTAIQHSYALRTSYTVTLLTTGLDNNLSHCIGLPSPFPILPKDKEIVSENCYGLMYIRDLTAGSNPFVQLLKMLSLGSAFDSEELPEENKEAESFLSKYFTQIANIARIKSISLPSVLIIAKDPAEKKTIEIQAAKKGVKIIFADRLPAEDFVAALKQVGKKGGVIACNGAQTLIQATILNSHFLFYANKSCNDNFLKHLLESMPSELKDTAAVILGLSDNTELLNNPEVVKKIHQYLQRSLQASLDKFERAKNQCMPKPGVSSDLPCSPKDICSHLGKITGIEWKFHSQSQVAFSNGISDAKILEFLKEKKFSAKERRVAQHASMWAGKSIMVIQLNKVDIEKLVKLSSSDDGIHKKKSSSQGSDPVASSVAASSLQPSFSPPP